MRCIVQLTVISVFFLSLISCATTDTSSLKDETLKTAVRGGLFEEWNDVVLDNTAVSQLIKQADMMIKYKQWSDAQGKLERTLRISPGYAPAWSRLSWLSLRASKLNKSVQLAQRSNSYTNIRELKILNWSFIRDAYQLMGNYDKVESAKNMLQSLRVN